MEIPFLGKFGAKNQNYQFKLKFGTYTNSNMHNSVVMFNGDVIIPLGLKLYQDNVSLEYSCLQLFFFMNRLVFAVLSQNIGESSTFVTLMEHS